MDGVTDSTRWLNSEGPDPQMEGSRSESFQSEDHHYVIHCQPQGVTIANLVN